MLTLFSIIVSLFSSKQEDKQKKFYENFINSFIILHFLYSFVQREPQDFRRVSPLCLN